MGLARGMAATFIVPPKGGEGGRGEVIMEEIWKKARVLNVPYADE